MWVQEEPENMGAWPFVRPLLEDIVGGRCPRHLRDGDGASEAVVERFKHEAEITGRLDHPSIVPIYLLGTDAETGRAFSCQGSSFSHRSRYLQAWSS